MQQNQCKATSSRSANSDEQIKGWILLLLHHDPQDKIKSFTDTRERISGRGTKLFDIRKVFSTRWDRLSRQPGKMSRTGKKKIRGPKSFFPQGEIANLGPFRFFLRDPVGGRFLGSPPGGAVSWLLLSIPSGCAVSWLLLGSPPGGAVWPATWCPRWTTQRLHGCQTEMCQKKLFGAWKVFFPSLPADRPLAIENKTLWPPKSFSSQAQACNRTNARLPRRGRLILMSKLRAESYCFCTMTRKIK